LQLSTVFSIDIKLTKIFTFNYLFLTIPFSNFVQKYLVFCIFIGFFVGKP